MLGQYPVSLFWAFSLWGRWKRCEQEKQRGGGIGGESEFSPSPPPALPIYLSSSLFFSRSLTSHHTLLSKRLDQASIPLIYLSFLDFVWERDMSHIQDRQFYRKVFSLVNNIFQPSFILNRTLHVLECTSCSCVKLNFLMSGAFNIRDYIRLIEIVKIPWLLPNILYFLVHVFSSL